MWSFRFQVLPTHPTPIVFALTASHVHASGIFLDWDLALRASMGSYHISPALIEFFLSLITSLILVPFSCTIKTHISFASVTFNFLRIFSSLYNLLAWSIRTKLFVLRYCNFMILSKLLKFFICFRIDYCLYHVFCNYFATALLRAFESVALSRLFNLILKEIFVSIFAKLVPAIFLRYKELALWMILVTNFTILGATCLKVFVFLFY